MSLQMTQDQREGAELVKLHLHVKLFKVYNSKRFVLIKYACKGFFLFLFKVICETFNLVFHKLWLLPFLVSYS